MHKLFGCSRVSPLSAPARPVRVPGPRGGQFGTRHSAPNGDGEWDESVTRRGPRKRHRRHRCHRRQTFPLTALAARVISTFSPLHHPTRWRSWGRSNTSGTGLRCPCPYCPLAAPSPLPRRAHPPCQSAKTHGPFLTPEPGSHTTSLLLVQPHAPWGGTAPWLRPRFPSGPSVPPTPLLIFSSVCCFSLCLLVLPRSFSRQEPRGSHHGALISLRDSSCCC